MVTETLNSIPFKTSVNKLKIVFLLIISSNSFKQLYLIWFGERSLSENETQDSVGGILGEVAIRSGGEILHIVGSENSQELEGSTVSVHYYYTR